MDVRAKQEAALSNDLNVITAEINAYKRVAGEAIFEIGRRLKHVKENDLVHGEWEKWCREDIGISPGQARMFVKVSDEFNGNRCTFNDLGLRALYEIATLPPEERERPHTIPSTGETKTVDEMTVRELREVKAELKREREARQRAEVAREEAVEEARVLRDTVESMVEEPPRVDQFRDSSLVERLKRYERRYGDIDAVESDGLYRITNSTEISGTALAFSTDIRALLKKYAFLTHYEREFVTLNQASLKEYMSAIESIRTFINDLQRAIPLSRSAEGEIIDIAI